MTRFFSYGPRIREGGGRKNLNLQFFCVIYQNPCFRERRKRIYFSLRDEGIGCDEREGEGDAWKNLNYTIFPGDISESIFL